MSQRGQLLQDPLISTSLKGCKIVAGGLRSAPTTGKESRMIRTLKRCQTEARMLHPSRVPSITCLVPVVYAPLRPPATFYPTLRVGFPIF